MCTGLEMKFYIQLGFATKTKETNKNQINVIVVVKKCGIFVMKKFIVLFSKKNLYIKCLRVVIVTNFKKNHWILIFVFYLDATIFNGFFSFSIFDT